MGKNYEQDLTPCLNLLGAGTTVEGSINTHGDIRIDGVFKGKIFTSAKLVIGNMGSVEGDIVCQNADIEGSVKANLKVAELMTLKATAFVTGDIKVGKIAIENGAAFSGKCSMLQANQDPKALDSE